MSGGKLSIDEVKGLYGDFRPFGFGDFAFVENINFFNISLSFKGSKIWGF